MEQQFNRRHGATNRTFSLGQLVLAKDYRDGVEKWTAGRILRRTGRVTYDVEVQSSIWVRHANQLRPSFQPVTVPSSRVIPLDILLDTFELPQDVSAAAPNPEAHPPSICTPRRWTDPSSIQRKALFKSMAPVDPVVKLFTSATSELSSLIDRYEALFKHEEEFPALFSKTELFGSHTTHPLSNVLSHLEDAQKTYENFQSVNKNYFSAPMAKICNLLPAISSLFTEREDLIKDIDKCQKKLHKFEGVERTGENLAKMAKHQGQLDTSITRLKAVDVLINRDLKELTLRTEVFLCRILKVSVGFNPHNFHCYFKLRIEPQHPLIKSMACSGTV
ncbi:hypothetical protein AHF37_06128 [Paragonimus kellicotti]|nr:hypothetical protein AHF37_06128 [Paragonimus kellicotti]